MALFQVKRREQKCKGERRKNPNLLKYLFLFWFKKWRWKNWKKNSILTEILKPKMCLSLIFSFREPMKLMTLMALICFQD